LPTHDRTRRDIVKKLVAALLALALMATFAAPAMAYRYLFVSIDTTKQIEIPELIGNWDKAVTEGPEGLEMDVGDLGYNAEDLGGERPAVVSPTVGGGQPLRSYIVDPEGVVRTFDMLISNEPEDINPPEAVGKLSGKDLAEAVVGFDQFEKLMQPGAVPQEELDAFYAKYQAQIEGIFERFTAYMTGAGFAGQYEASVEDLTKALYIAVNYLNIGNALTAILDNTEDPDRCAFFGTEFYKGFLATFLDDEASMKEFATIIYIWMEGEKEGEETIGGAPYAYVAYDRETGKWSLVDIFQLTIDNDEVKKLEIWDAIIDAQYFISVESDTPVMALYYDAKDGQWKIAGLNAPCFEMLAQNVGTAE
jgi:hypothetical protein